MQRYNIFSQVHKGLRALLFETALDLQHTDFWDVDQANPVMERLDEIIDIFESHAHTEDTHVFPLVEKYEQSVADAFEQEHVKDHLLGQLLSESIGLYRSANVITDKAEAAKQVLSAYSKFMIFNVEHMAREEDIINSVLWRYHSDPELIAVTRQIVASLPAAHLAAFGKWMIRGLNNPEVTAWLKQVEKEAPAPVFNGLLATAERELPVDRFRQVSEGLAEGAMLA